MVTSDQADPAFEIINRHSTAFIIWRVENFKLVSLTREQFGKFFKGDSYLVYVASEGGCLPRVNEKSRGHVGPLETHIHFWIGSETSQDEAGVAAIKTVELDAWLGGAPVQHRETEGNESKRFLSYFKQGIRYLNGGFGTGFRRVKDDFSPSLYRVKGKRLISVTELPQVSWSYMNDGDVFILDRRDYIFVWTGRYSNYLEKLQGAKLATRLKDEHGGGHIVIVEDGREGDLSPDERASLEASLPLNEKHVLPWTACQKDEIVTRRFANEIKLFRCSDDSGTIKMTEMKQGPFSQKDLDSNDSYIIDNGVHGVWVWVGKRASRKEREEALRNAQGFISKKGYPPHTHVSRIVDGGEPTEFRSLFSDWKEKDHSKVKSKLTTPTVQTKFDATALHERPEIAARTQMFDDGSGQKEIWRIRNFDLVEVPEEFHGEFCSGDCYIILYAYATHSRDNYVLYYWLGSSASSEEMNSAALKAIELDQRLQGRAVQVRVTQGKEPPHFMAILGGKMLIYNGSFASFFDGKSSTNRRKKGSHMLHVTGSLYCTKAIEVDFRAASLNSYDCFIISTPQEVYIWCGRGSTGDERECAKSLARVTREAALVSEGYEKESFWNSLGGKEDYSSSALLREENSSRPPRLFHISNSSGILKAEEILNYDQSDLVEDDIMLLDAWNTIFIWIGMNSNKVEEMGAENIALEYLRTDPAGRSLGTAIMKIKQGFEPPNFTGFFGTWNDSLWKNLANTDLITRLQGLSPGATVIVTPSINSANGSATQSKNYPLSALLSSDTENLPIDIDPTCKEDFLCDTDFVEVFGISREDFNQFPLWKKLALKKKVGLF